MTNETETTDVTKSIAAEDVIWDADDAVIEEKGRFLSIEEQKGVVELELTMPLVVDYQEADITHLNVKAPSMDDISKTNGNVRQLIGKCIVGVSPRDVVGLHGRDYVRLQSLIRHFLV